MLSIPMQMMIVAVAGWVNREQQAVIDYQGEEVRVYHELCGKRRLRFNDDQRRRLAAKGRRLGRRVLGEIGTIVKPDTIIRWYRELIARKYDGSEKRRPGRPRVMERIRAFVGCGLNPRHHQLETAWESKATSDCISRDPAGGGRIYAGKLS